MTTQEQNHAEATIVPPVNMIAGILRSHPAMPTGHRALQCCCGASLAGTFYEQHVAQVLLGEAEISYEWSHGGNRSSDKDFGSFTTAEEARADGEAYAADHKARWGFSHRVSVVEKIVFEREV
ncbi:MAG: hypothetical protein ACOH1Y_16895 [Propionicimonas sp.]